MIQGGIETCPFCNSGTLSEVGETITCEVCGVLNKTLLLAKVFNMTPKEIIKGKHLGKSLPPKPVVSTGVEMGSLIEILDRFHYDENGVYKKNITVIPRILVETVHNWFIENGGKFLFNFIDDCGYLIFRKDLYVCDSRNRKFLSLLWDVGRISVATNDGKIIIAGLCALAATSESVVLRTWIDGNPKENIIKINQGSSTIILSNNIVDVKEREEITFESLLGDRWFVPIKFDKDVEIGKGLELLDKNYIKWLAIPPVAREIVTCWTLSVFLKDFSSICAGVRISGKYSSGKSTVLYLSNWLFYGNENLGVIGNSTAAGLWRKASVEPIIFLDNENVRKSLLSESLQKSLDLSATGAARLIATKDSSQETKNQSINTFIMISGLDPIMHQDVKTRYIEIIAPVVRKDGRDENPYKGQYIEREDKPLLLEARDTIMSAILKLITVEVLPNLNEVKDRDMYFAYSKRLAPKERITDYFMIMSLLGKAFQKYGIFEPGDIRERWIKYITDISSQTGLQNSATIEWWELFKIQYNMKPEDVISYVIENPNKCERIIENDKVVGVCGTKEFLYLCMRWVNKQTGNPCPWTRATELIDEMNSDLEAWKAKEADGWKYVEGQKNTVRFGS